MRSKRAAQRSDSSLKASRQSALKDSVRGTSSDIFSSDVAFGFFYIIILLMR
jgi:hypothetical protein